MDTSQMTVIVVSVIMLFSSLLFLMWISDSRFSALTQKLSFSHKAVPEAFNPYIAQYHPIETFEELNPFKEARAKVTLYNRVNRNPQALEGRSIEIDKDTTDVGQLDTRSIVLGPFTKVELYTSANYRGTPTKIINDKDEILLVSELNKEYTPLAGKIRSVKLEIIYPYAIVFTEVNNGGISKIVRGNIPVLIDRWRSITSMKLPPYTKISLYTENAYRGKPKTYENATSTMRTIGFIGNDMNNRVRSVQVEGMIAV